jgi:hypothetical protein
MDSKWKWTLGIAGAIGVTFTGLTLTGVSIREILKFETHGPTVMVGTQSNRIEKGPISDATEAFSMMRDALTKQLKLIEDREAELKTVEGKLAKARKEIGEYTVALSTIVDLRKQLDDKTKDLDTARKEASKVEKLQAEATKWRGDAAKWKQETAQKQAALDGARDLLRRLTEKGATLKSARPEAFRPRDVPMCIELGAFPVLDRDGVAAVICDGRVVAPACRKSTWENEGDGFSTYLCDGVAVASTLTVSKR